ncbi:xaa-Pro aminopeptidase ApepP [Orussus abietinus]|uniref:xaa-Pro aminopeptidase ApepP n=1 Tax=Orussus abietinus TaxID=222816 RepID=UPI0006254E0C|nr:xaa-Pro aminopeptidase ApepP [Orussus abietinus]
MAGKNGALKLEKLRKLMAAVKVPGVEGKGIQALVVKMEDAHQSEYIKECDQRCRFISGFSGSFGTAIITMDKALLWTDGRYFLQALKEFDPPDAWTLMKYGVMDTPSEAAWLVSNLPSKSIVGADPNLISYAAWVPLDNALVAAGHRLIPLKENLVDEVWGEEQPPLTLQNILPHPVIYSGERAGDKIEHCRREMQKNQVTTLVVTALDDVAYVLNLRGSDIPCNPVFFAYVVITLQDVHFFVEESKLTAEAKEHLIEEGICPKYHPYKELRSFLKQNSCVNGENEKLWISYTSSYILHNDCKDVRKHTTITPISLMKTIKNSVEIEGMKAAYIRDSVALVKYFSWLEDRVKSKDKEITEISGADRLEKFRQQQDKFVQLSFPTISSVGPHAAIIHYITSPATNVPITDQEIYLCDSGAQYQDGTTDITRTLHFGIPSDYERECFTRVFKGQCLLSTTIFPLKIQGNHLDSLPRRYLWAVGLDYSHGTGHGVGAYLNVHESPIGISWRPNPDDPGLEAGMFLSNEPGYYEDGKFGIRLENIELVVKAQTPHNHKNRGFLTFETVSLVPIQTKLLDFSMLTDTEVEYLNAYHQRCLTTLEPLLQKEEDRQALQWLRRETQPIHK